ncbi:MAG: replication-associated recombination protein A [bacterium]
MEFFDSIEARGQEAARESTPLADRMRPRTLDEFVGQSEVVGEGAPLHALISGDKLRSMIFWGPPGSGKTTLAAIIARHTKSDFMSMSAVAASIKDAKAVMEHARSTLSRSGKRTILFIDEIHRFNKAQQDAFLPFVEDGSIILIGATTENPSFSVISALLSRCQVFILKALTEENLLMILRAALADKTRGLGAAGLTVAERALEQIASVCDGDARRALNLIEFAAEITQPDEAGKRIDGEIIKQALQRQHLIYDKTGEEHYNTISALHKAMRGSDAQAAVYWIGRMLASGEDPLFLARRMVRFASEDVGNADPQALIVALAAREAYAALGSPEGELALIQCAIYLAAAPKSNAAYTAELRVKAEIEKTGALPVPLHIRNAPTQLMKEAGYGKGYQYDHDAENRFSAQTFLPDQVKTRLFYEPPNIGFEREIIKRMQWWEKLRNEARKKNDSDA